MEHFEKILQFLGLLSVPSIGWNIFQYLSKRKLDKIELRKKIELKKIEIEEIENKHKEEDRKNSYRSSRYMPHEDAKKEELRVKNQTLEMKRLYTEFGYLQELNGNRNLLLFPESKLSKIKKKLRRIVTAIKISKK